MPPSGCEHDKVSLLSNFLIYFFSMILPRNMSAKEVYREISKERFMAFWSNYQLVINSQVFSWLAFGLPFGRGTSRQSGSARDIRDRAIDCKYLG